jgi:hypothetical protein
MAEVNFKGEKQYRRFSQGLCLQDIEDIPVGEIVAKNQASHASRARFAEK